MERGHHKHQGEKLLRLKLLGFCFGTSGTWIDKFTHHRPESVIIAGHAQVPSLQTLGLWNT